MNTDDFEENFSDFLPDELKGRIVLHEFGRRYDPKFSYRITKISKVTTTGFRVESDKEIIFDFTGQQKGLNTRKNLNYHSRVFLLTEDQAEELEEKWAKDHEAKAMRTVLRDKLDLLSHEQLTVITNLIK